MNKPLNLIRPASLLLAALLLVSWLAPNAGAAEQSLQISLNTTPDPPRSGNNAAEVTVLDAAGTPISNATVEVRFYMPAMPSMNMPEMAANFPMVSAGNGRYKGNGKLVMGGTWEVTVTVSRDGKRVGRKKFTVNAKP